LAVTDPDGNVQPYRLSVKTVYQVRASEIPERHIHDDGFLDLEDMISGMASFYPGFSADTECTVVLFELAE
jgi:hypothetical protein